MSVNQKSHTVQPLVIVFWESITEILKAKNSYLHFSVVEANCSAGTFSFMLFLETLDMSEQAEYSDDFEEDEDRDDPETDAASVHTAAHQQTQDETLVEEFQLCDAGGLTVTLKALKERG